jgi:hypothetical protein
MLQAPTMLAMLRLTYCVTIKVQSSMILHIAMQPAWIVVSMTDDVDIQLPLSTSSSGIVQSTPACCLLRACYQH